MQNTIWWIEYAGLAGLRADTWGYSDRDFLARWTQAVLAEYPKLNIVGEEWSGNPVVVSYWLRGKADPDGYVSHLPSAMDFPLRTTAAMSVFAVLAAIAFSGSTAERGASVVRGAPSRR